ncbi:MAG: hypothetical protein ACXWT1_10805 [Methylobacter sp.]
MSDLEEIAKSLQEIEKKIALMGASHEEVLIQKIADGAMKRLFHNGLFFMAGVGIAGFGIYLQMVNTITDKVLTQFNDVELPVIRKENTAKIEKEFSMNNPLFQKTVETIVKEEIEVTKIDYTRQLNDLIKVMSPKLGGTEFITQAEKSITSEEDTNPIQGWSFYGVRNPDKTWKVRYFEPAEDVEDSNALPYKGITVIAKGNINFRQNPPSYDNSDWSYSAAKVTGSIKKKERAIVQGLKETPTDRGTYVWINMSSIKQ